MTRGRVSRRAHADLVTHLTMAPERATALQTALIKAGYMTGEPSGAWDQPSEAAMEKLQADNGWQTKIVPDSRAIIKLGLGPNTSAGSPAVHSSAETASSANTTTASTPVIE